MFYLYYTKINGFFIKLNLINNKNARQREFIKFWKARILGRALYKVLKEKY